MVLGLHCTSWTAHSQQAVPCRCCAMKGLRAGWRLAESWDTPEMRDGSPSG